MAFHLDRPLEEVLSFRPKVEGEVLIQVVAEVIHVQREEEASLSQVGEVVSLILSVEEVIPYP